MEEEKSAITYSSWGGYYDAVKSCNENIKKLSELDAVFSHIENIENLTTFSHISKYLKTISKEDQNKLNSPLLDDLIKHNGPMHILFENCKIETFIFIMNLYKKEINSLGKDRVSVKRICTIYEFFDEVVNEIENEEKIKILVDFGAVLEKKTVKNGITTGITGYTGPVGPVNNVGYDILTGPMITHYNLLNNTGATGPIGPIAETYEDSLMARDAEVRRVERDRFYRDYSFQN